MQDQMLQTGMNFSNKPAAKLSSLRRRSDEVLVAVATLGLVATIVDGDADSREIESFTREFRKRFALSRRHSVRLIAAALGRIRLAREVNIIDCACDTLNEYLDTPQKIRLFDGLAEVLVSDGKIHEGEEYFLDYIADKLDLVDSIVKRYPII